MASSSTSELGGLEPAFAHIAADEAAIVADMERLLGCDTSFPPGTGYRPFADLMEATLGPLGFGCRRVTVPEALWRSPGAAGERVNVIAARRTGRPVCAIYFHVDTVPPGDGWTREPIACTREGERVYGRGAADMKGAIAAVLAAIRAANANGIALAYDPVLLLCTDEEGGLYPGIRYLAEQELIEGHLLSFNGGAAPRIWAGCFGSFDLLVEVPGVAAHSGEPGRGVNAIEAAMPLLNALMALKARVQSRRSAMRGRDGAPLRSLLTIAAAHGGQKGSSLPARFELLLNRRYAPEERFEAALEEIESVVDANSFGATTTLLGHLAPVSDPAGPHWPRWQRALSAGFGWPVESFRAWGASTSSDMGWVQQAGIREILLGGLSRPEHNVHGADEFTTLPDLEALARSVLAYLAADFAPDMIPEASP
jgi:succinyl-diaminopimelate desuccinylase